MNWHGNKHLHNFHGGIHPPENKAQSTQSAIEPALLPSKLILPLQQHIGQLAKPLVNIGDRVLKGQMIAAAQGFVSAAVHAPTSGTVTAIAQHGLPHPSGLSEQCITIKTDGQDEWSERHPIDDYRQVDKDTLLKHIRDAGITGLGGAGFPTAVKLSPSEDLLIDTLILNAAECEPYITADDMLMRERAQEVIQGLQIIAHLLQTEHCQIGIEDNKPEAIAALQQVVEEENLTELIRVVRIPTKYPSGGEKQLIQILTGKEVPNGGIPADIGIVCHNVGTAVAVYRAVIKGEPLISRITTLTGEALGRQGNIEVMLGTPVEELLTHFEADQDALHRLVMGGPMMGFTLDSTELPIVKATNCILAATSKELPDPAPEQACIRCGMCAEVCPATLLPQQLYWFSKSREFDKALSHNLLDCIECGACSYVCPSNIPLVQYYRFAKGEIRLEEHERTASDHARQRFEARQARLEQEEAEKEAKRIARAEAAAAAKKAKDADGDKAKEVDPKAAVVQAALERAKARKAQKAAQADTNATDSPTEEKPKATGMSAVERAKLKKAQREAEQTAAGETSSETKPALSAVERAKARKAARAAEQPADREAKSEKPSGLSALERAKAKRAQQGEPSDTVEKTAETNNANKDETETKPSAGLSALERAKAKRAAQENETASDNTPAVDTEQKPASGMSALERAKAKRAQAASEQPGAENSETTNTGGMSALERAKAKRAQKEQLSQQSESSEPAEVVEKPMSALERAKLKRAQQAEAEQSTSDDERD